MFGLFRVLSERLRTMFIADLAIEFEAELASREALRRADLLQQVHEYQTQGLGVVADRLRRQAEALSFQNPLASVLPALSHMSEPVLPEDRVASTAAASATAKGRRLVARKGGGA